MYASLFRPLLFCLNAERSHQLALHALRAASHSRMLCAMVARGYAKRVPCLPVHVMGLDFPNPVGLAAGLDKDAVAIDAFAALGFGFIEVGTVTPRAQPGNAHPRLFRLPAQQAIINRLGFNNAGVAAAVRAMKRRRSRTLLGVNLGKNADTPLSEAARDYLIGLEAVFELADYVAINISSPNTPGLRSLQSGTALAELLHALREKRAYLQKLQARTLTSRTLRIALKISPDLNEKECEVLCQTLQRYPVDALIATNTTVARDKTCGDESCDGLSKTHGGLSGTPLRRRATAVIKLFYQHLQGQTPIIGVGGISNAADAWEKLCAGADLVQIYTSLIYHGPSLVLQIINGLHKRVVASGHDNLTAAVASARDSV